MKTRAVRDGDDWIINGRKIWITRAAEADFTILMAITDPEKGARGGMSAFLVDRDTPGFIVERRIPMVGGEFTY
jgi:acyl-CoA dehydrogenase